MLSHRVCKGAAVTEPSKARDAAAAYRVLDWNNIATDRTAVLLEE